MLGVNVQKFHRLVAKHGLKPAVEVPGKRGAKFWRRRDVEALEQLVRQPSPDVIAEPLRPPRKKGAA